MLMEMRELLAYDNNPNKRRRGGQPRRLCRRRGTRKRAEFVHVSFALVKPVSANWETQTAVFTYYSVLWTPRR